MKALDLVSENKRLRADVAAAKERLRRAGSEAGDLLKELAALRLALDLERSRCEGLCARVVELEDAAVAAMGGSN